MPGCRVLHPDIVAALPLLERLTAQGAPPSGDLSVTITKTDTGLDVAIRGGAPGDAALAAMAEGGWARVTWNGETLGQERPPIVRIGGARVAPPPGAFLQATGAGEAALVASVRAAVGPAGRIADLFAGCGTFALPLAAQADVAAFEGDAAMVRALDAARRQPAIRHTVTASARDLFRRPLLAAELDAYEAVVIDPPRAGAAAQMREIAASRVPVVASVSCDAGTFARDARILVDGGFAIDWVRVVDQFRWSSHVEIAARFVRAPAARG